MADDATGAYSGPELCARTATEVVAMLRRGEVSPRELTEAALARHAEVDGAVNAMPAIGAERALAHADAVPRAGDETAHPGWLGGVPVSIKDPHDVAGLPTTFGNLAFKDNIAKTSEPMVQRIEARGGVVIGKSNMPEFGAGAHTFNDVYGTTCNPWNTGRSAGGSTGGGAAALATGQVWLSQGSDLGGSLRTPAAWCGVVGMRPSPGRVGSASPEQAFFTETVAGPMARNVADCALFLDTMAGFSAGNPLSFPADDAPYAAAVAEAEGALRIAYAPDLGGLFALAGEVRAVMDAALARCAGAGHVVEAEAPRVPDLERCFRTIRGLHFAASLGRAPERVARHFKQTIRENIAFGEALSLDDIIDAQRAKSQIFFEAARLLGQFDVLACAVVGCGPQPVDREYPEAVGGVPTKDYLSHLCYAGLSTISSLPAISLPIGHDPDGLPVGLQLIGPPRGEAALLRAARLIEMAAGQTRGPIDPVSA